MIDRIPCRAQTLYALLSVACLTAAQAQLPARKGAEDPGNPCGMIYDADQYGPYDYRTHRYTELKKVEDFHFTSKVENLREGQSGYIGGDIDYTLRASPNHHRALVAISRWAEKTKSDKTNGMTWDVECYFNRGVRYRPDDTVVRALYAQFLHKRKRTDEGLRHLDTAVGFAGESAFSHYNLGLIYFELGAYDKALAQAHRAAAMGFPRQDLKNQLTRAGKWVDAPAEGSGMAATAKESAAAASAPN